MTPRSLFVIIIKVLGIFMLKDLILSGVFLVEGLYLQGVGSNGGAYATLISAAVSVIINGTLFYVLVFRPEIVINKLKLDKGFYEESFQMSMDKLVMMQIGVIVAGLFLVVDTVPDICRDIIAYFQFQVYRNSVYPGGANRFGKDIVYAGVKLIAAYIMLTNSGYLANFITNNKGKKQAPEQ